MFLPLYLLLCAGATWGAKVLFMPSTLYPVHAYTMKHLADELASRGHEVTWIEYGPVQTKTVLSQRVERIFWPVQFEDKTLQKIFVDKTHATHELIWEPGFDLPNEQTTAWLGSIRLCDKLLQKHKEKFEEIVQRRFDTVIVDDLYNPCGLLQVGLKGSVFIYWSMTSLRTESAWANQSPSPPSYLPVPGTKLTEDMTFTERVFNLASYLRALYIHQHVVHNRIDAIFQKYYPGVATAFDIERNASINFVNNPPIFDFARPFMPRVNFVGGLHCHNATAIGGNLGLFVDAASESDGFVVISTGFTADWNKAPVSVRTACVNAMKAHSSTRFVWQYDGPIIDFPKNVFTQKWLPLQNLLGHKKCRAHVSHGGLNSVIESVWHGVPLLGVPLTVQGHDNILRVSARGAGILLPKSELDENTLATALTEIRTKKYKEEILVFQDMLRDVPYSELTHAAFWVEFIDRHQEVPHARSGADKLNILQYFLVDVISFLLSLLAILIATVIFIVRVFLRSLKFIHSKMFGKRAKSLKKVTKSKKRN